MVSGERRQTEATRLFADALLTQQGLPQALTEVAASLGNADATLVVGRTHESSVICTEAIQPFVADYFQDWWRHDPREARVQPQLGQGFTCDWDDFTADQIDQEPYYQEFLIPRGYCWHATAALAVAPAPWVISLKRQTVLGAYESHEIQQLNRALPHLRAAAELAHQAWRLALRGDLQLLQHFDKGAIVLDAQGRVIEANSSAPLGNGLALINGRLQAQLRGEQPALEAAIHAAQRLDADVPQAHKVLLHHSRTRGTLLVECISMRYYRHDLQSTAAVMVVSTELQQLPKVDPFALKNIFEITTREAELCVMLAAGMHQIECAEQLGIGINHTRQLARQVYQKLGVRGQPELAAMIARLY